MNKLFLIIIIVLCFLFSYCYYKFVIKKTNESFSSSTTHYYKGRKIIWSDIKINGMETNNFIWNNETSRITGKCSIHTSNYQSFDDSKLLITIGLKDDIFHKVYDSKTKANNINTSICMQDSDCSNLGIPKDHIGDNHGEWSCHKNKCIINCHSNSDCGDLKGSTCHNKKCVFRCSNNDSCNNDLIGGYKCKNTKKRHGINKFLHKKEKKICVTDSGGITYNKKGDIIYDNPYYNLNGIYNNTLPFNNIQKCKDLGRMYPIDQLEKGDFSEELVAPSGTWKSSAKNIETSIENGKHILKAELLNNLNMWVQNTLEYEPTYSYSNNNGKFKKDVNVTTTKVCHKKKRHGWGRFGHKSKYKTVCHKKKNIIPIITDPGNPQIDWDNSGCNMKPNNKIYEFNFSVDVNPGNNIYGVTPLFVGYGLSSEDTAILKKNDAYNTFSNYNLNNGGNIGLINDIFVRQRYLPFIKSYTKCSSVCGGGKQFPIVKCRDNKNHQELSSNVKCSGLITEAYLEEVDCNTEDCPPQPNIQNVFCYISVSKESQETKDTYTSTKNNRLGIRNYDDYNKKKELKKNPYYKYTRTFIGNSEQLNTEWAIIVVEMIDKNNLSKVYIYNSKFKLFLSYDNQMNISTVGQDLLNDNCLWVITSKIENTAIYNIKHFNTQKYLYSTNPIIDYVDGIFRNKVENFNYEELGQLNCSYDKQQNWFIIPIKPLSLNNTNFDELQNYCESNNNNISSKKEFSEFSQLGGIDNENKHWTNNKITDTKFKNKQENKCQSWVLNACNKKFAWLLLLLIVNPWLGLASYFTALATCSSHYGDKCAIKKKNLKKVHIVKQQNQKMQDEGLGWIRNYDGKKVRVNGYGKKKKPLFRGNTSRFGRHPTDNHDGICVQRQLSMNEILKK